MAVVIGWVLGKTVTLHDLCTAAVFAVLAGGIVLNGMKEELPDQRESPFSAFAGGLIPCAALLLAT